MDQHNSNSNSSVHQHIEIEFRFMKAVLTEVLLSQQRMEKEIVTLRQDFNVLCQHLHPPVIGGSLSPSPNLMTSSTSTHLSSSSKLADVSSGQDQTNNLAVSMPSEPDATSSISKKKERFVPLYTLYLC
jgi:hypothetical protein